MYDAFSTADYALLRLAMEKRVLERIKKRAAEMFHFQKSPEQPLFIGFWIGGLQQRTSL